MDGIVDFIYDIMPLHKKSAAEQAIDEIEADLKKALTRVQLYRKYS
jgi:hypothetical protein